MEWSFEFNTKYMNDKSSAVVNMYLQFLHTTFTVPICTALNRVKCVIDQARLGNMTAR